MTTATNFEYLRITNPRHATRLFLTAQASLECKHDLRAVLNAENKRFLVCCKLTLLPLNGVKWVNFMLVQRRNLDDGLRLQISGGFYDEEWIEHLSKWVQ